MSAAARACEAAEEVPVGDTVPTDLDRHGAMRESKYSDYLCTRETAEGVYSKRKVKGQELHRGEGCE